MNPFDLGNIGAMLGGFQQRMEEMKRKSESTIVEGKAGGGLVSVKITCAYDCLGVTIDPKVAGDPEMLEDLLRAAINEALRQAKDETKRNMGDLASGLPIPPGLLPPGF